MSINIFVYAMFLVLNQVQCDVKPRLCHGQADVMKVVAGLGASSVLTFCVDAFISSQHYPYLKVFDRWIRSGANDYDKVNFTYVSSKLTVGRHNVSVSFNNITVSDYQYVNLTLMTGFKENVTIQVRIQNKETCREIFKVNEVDGFDFLLLCYSDCFPRSMGIRRKQFKFYINEWKMRTPYRNYTLKASGINFTCTDQAIYACDIKYSEEFIVVKEIEVILTGCPRNETLDEFIST